MFPYIETDVITKESLAEKNETLQYLHSNEYEFDGKANIYEKTLENILHFIEEKSEHLTNIVQYISNPEQYLQSFLENTTRKVYHETFHRSFGTKYYHSQVYSCSSLNSEGVTWNDNYGLFSKSACQHDDQCEDYAHGAKCIGSICVSKVNQVAGGICEYHDQCPYSKCRYQRYNDRNIFDVSQIISRCCRSAAEVNINTLYYCADLDLGDRCEGDDQCTGLNYADPFNLHYPYHSQNFLHYHRHHHSFLHLSLMYQGQADFVILHHINVLINDQSILLIRIRLMILLLMMKLRLSMVH